MDGVRTELSTKISKSCSLSAAGPKFDLRSTHAKQVGTLTVHFPEVSGGTYQKFSSPKLGELRQIDVFQYRMLCQWGKSNPKLRFFNIPRTKNR